MFFQTLIWISTIVVLHIVGVSPSHPTIDMCDPCDEVDAQQTDIVSQFYQSLGHLRGRFTYKLNSLTNTYGIDNLLSEYPGWTDASIFRPTDRMMDAMLTSYRSLTELAANLTMLNHIRTRHVVGYITYVQTPVCYLWRALRRHVCSCRSRGDEAPCGLPRSRSRGYEAPCALHRGENIHPPSGPHHNLTVAVNFAYQTLHRGIYLTDDIRQYFQRYLSCSR